MPWSQKAKYPLAGEAAERSLRSRGSAGGVSRRTLALATILIPLPTFATGHELAGTYQLVNSSTKHLDADEAVQDENAKGLIMYGADGRMLVLIAYGDRPKAESSAKLTDEQRAGLFRKY